MVFPPVSYLGFPISSPFYFFCFTVLRVLFFVSNIRSLLVGLHTVNTYTDMHAIQAYNSDKKTIRVMLERLSFMGSAHEKTYIGIIQQVYTICGYVMRRQYQR